jgi:hypothetical protein
VDISIRFMNKRGSTAAIRAVQEGPRVWLTKQKWAPSGRRLEHRALKVTTVTAERFVEQWKVDFLRLGWTITSEGAASSDTTWRSA